MNDDNGVLRRRVPDIVRMVRRMRPAGFADPLLAEAADALEAMEAENAKLREALRDLCGSAFYLAGRGYTGGMKRPDAERAVLAKVANARALLEEAP